MDNKKPLCYSRYFTLFSAFETFSGAAFPSHSCSYTEIQELPHSMATGASILTPTVSSSFASGEPAKNPEIDSCKAVSTLLTCFLHTLGRHQLK